MYCSYYHSNNQETEFSSSSVLCWLGSSLFLLHNHVSLPISLCSLDLHWEHVSKIYCSFCWYELTASLQQAILPFISFIFNRTLYFQFQFFRSGTYFDIYPNYSYISYYLNNNHTLLSLNFLLYVKLLEGSHFIKFKLCLSLSLLSTFCFSSQIFPDIEIFFLEQSKLHKELHFWNK